MSHMSNWVLNPRGAPFGYLVFVTLVSASLAGLLGIITAGLKEIVVVKR